MNGELDLELYTIAIIRLNTAFQKLDDGNVTDEIAEMFKSSAEDLQTFYEDVIDDINAEEVNFGEYYPFFKNGKVSFPQYIEVLENTEYDELSGSLETLINVFTNLNKIASEFSDEMIK